MAQIGPDSFTLTPRQPVGASAGQGAPQAQVGIQGRGAVSTGQQGEYIPDNSGSKNMAAIAQIAGSLLEPVIKKQQQARFDEGMRRAAQGEAAKDIEAERPAWARFFGEGDVTLAARAYEGAADAASLETAISTAMPGMAHLDTATAQKQFTEMANKQKTGDPNRDAAIDRSLFSIMPNVLKAHAKANWDYAQKDAAFQRDRYTVGEMVAFESVDRAARQPDSLVSEKDYENAKLKARGLLVPAPGEDQERRDESIVNGLLTQMTQGNFAFANLLRSDKIDDSRTVWDLLPAKHLDRLNQMYRSVGKVALWERMGTEEFDAVRQVKYNSPDSASLDAGIDRINAHMTEKTGILVDALDAGDRMAGRSAIDQRREAEERLRHSRLTAAQKEAEKKANFNANVSRYASALMDPSAPPLKAQLMRDMDTSEDKSGAYKAAVELGWGNVPTGYAPQDIVARTAARVTLIKNNDDTTRPFKALKETAFSAPQHGAAVGELVEVLRALPDRARWKQHGFTDDQIRQIDGYEKNLAQGSMKPAEAWEQAGIAAKHHKSFDGPSSKEDREALAQAVKEFQDEQGSMDDSVSPAGAAVLTILATPHMAEPTAIGDRAMAARGAVRAIKEGSGRVGKTIWFQSNPADRDARSWLHDGSGKKPPTDMQFSNAFNAVLEEQVGKAGRSFWKASVKANELLPMRLADGARPDGTGGQLAFNVLVPEGGHGEDVGKALSVIITGEMLQAWITKGQKAEQAKPDEVRKAKEADKQGATAKASGSDRRY